MLFLSLLALSIKICLAESAASLLHLPTILPRRHALPALEGADEIVQAGKTGVQRDLRQALIRGNDFMGGDLHAVVGQVFHGRAVSGLLEKTTEIFRGHVQRISHLIQRNGRGVFRFNHLKHPPQLHDLVGCERRLFTGEGVRAVLIDLSQKLEQASQRDELVAAALRPQRVEQRRNGMADNPVVTGKVRLHRQLQIKNVCDLPLAMVVALEQQPHIEHNAVVLAVVGYAAVDSRKPIGAAPTISNRRCAP